jgi:hypothetical protein
VIAIEVVHLAAAAAVQARPPEVHKEESISKACTEAKHEHAYLENSPDLFLLVLALGAATAFFLAWSGVAWAGLRLHQARRSPAVTMQSPSDEKRMDLTHEECTRGNDCRRTPVRTSNS